MELLEYVSPETFSRVTDNMNSAIRKLEAKDNAQREKYAIEELLNVDDNLSLHIWTHLTKVLSIRTLFAPSLWQSTNL